MGKNIKGLDMDKDFHYFSTTPHWSTEVWIIAYWFGICERPWNWASQIHPFEMKTGDCNLAHFHRKTFTCHLPQTIQLRAIQHSISNSISSLLTKNKTKQTKNPINLFSPDADLEGLLTDFSLKELQWSYSETQPEYSKKTQLHPSVNVYCKNVSGAEHTGWSTPYLWAQLS